MTRKFLKNQEKSSRIRKKIDDYNKYQWLVFIPVWAVAILNVLFSSLVPEIYVVFFDVGTFLFSVIAFVVIRLQVRRLNGILIQIEKADNYIPARFKLPRR